MTLEAWLAFAAAAFVIGIVPGPGVASIVGFAFTSGRRVALASVAGMALGNALAISVSLAGAGAVLAASPLAFRGLTWAGAAYLVAIGLVASLRAGPAVDGAPPRAASARAAFLTNVAVGSFHPKTILFFVAFAAGFIRPDAAYLPQAAILVATFTLIAAATDTGYALAASTLSGPMRHPRVRLGLQRAGGVALIVAGVAILLLRT